MFPHGAAPHLPAASSGHCSREVFNVVLSLFSGDLFCKSRVFSVILCQCSLRCKMVTVHTVAVID